MKIHKLTKIFKRKHWQKPNADPSLKKEKHNCGMIALQTIFPKLTTEKLKEAFLFCSEKWPHDGIKKREMNIILKFLKLNHRVQYKEASQKKISLKNLLKNKKKTYIALFPSHYLVVKKGMIIDHHGAKYYKKRNKILIHCYWEIVNFC